MEFRLTYEGPLFVIQRDPIKDQVDRKADHKHHLRKVFHKQLKRLWEVTPFLKVDEQGRAQIRTRKAWSDTGEPHSPERLSEKHGAYGFKFVPLVTQDIELFCALEILFLRPDKPGGVIWAGDIDNRIKTLIDALRIPTANERYDFRKPDTEEVPYFFCLLEDDKLVTKLSVETDQLLEFVTPAEEVSEVRLVITVHIWPYAMHIGNLEFGGG